jgi:hypothetical protein
MGERPKSCRVALPGTRRLTAPWSVPCSQPLHLHHPSLDKQLHPRDMARIIEARNATTLAPGPPSHPLAPAPAGRHSLSIHPVPVCRSFLGLTTFTRISRSFRSFAHVRRSGAPQPLSGCTRQKAACPSPRRRMRSAQSRILASRDHHVRAICHEFSIRRGQSGAGHSTVTSATLSCGLPAISQSSPSPAAARRPGRWMWE